MNNCKDLGMMAHQTMEAMPRNSSYYNWVHYACHTAIASDIEGFKLGTSALDKNYTEILVAAWGFYVKGDLGYLLRLDNLCQQIS